MNGAPDFRTLLVRRKETHPFLANGMFDAIPAGPFSLSIQASDTHYSQPREKHPEASHYYSFEVAIFEGKEWVNPRTDPRFDGVECAEAFEDAGSAPVGGYIPAEQVQELYERCLAIGGAS